MPYCNIHLPDNLLSDIFLKCNDYNKNSGNKPLLSSLDKS